MPDTLPQTPIKEEVLQMIQRLPNDCTLEDIQYHLYVRAKIQEALKNLADGKNLTPEEVEQRMAEWLKSFGSNPR